MRFSLVMLLLSAVGCQAVVGTNDSSVAPFETTPAHTAVSNRAYAVRPASAEMPPETGDDELVDLPAAEPESVQPPTDAVALTLDAAIRTSLRWNPALVALRQDEPVSRAALLVAGAYPYDPSVAVTVEPESRFDGGTRGSVLNSVQVMQTLELAHQGRYRRQAGSAQWNWTRWNISRAELRNIAETERRFFAVLHRRKAYQLTSKLADLNEELLGVLRRRLEAGQATAADVALAEMEARSARQQAEVAQVALESARLDLQAHLGLDPGSPCVVAGSIEDWSWASAEDALAGWARERGSDMPSDEIPADQAVAVLVAGRPDVQAAVADLQAAVAACKLAQASRAPNVDLGPVYERDESKTVFWGMAAQMDLPVFHSRPALAFKRRVEVRRKEVVLQQLQRRAMMEIEAALKRYQRRRSLVERFHKGDEELVRQVQSVEDLFQAGQTDLLRVYAARSQALRVRTNYLDAIDALTRAAGDLIESSGVGPEALATRLN